MSSVNALVANAKLAACLVDVRGLVVEISEGWRSESQAYQVELPDVGANYLVYCLTLVSSSVLYRGVRQVLRRDSALFVAPVTNALINGQNGFFIMIALTPPSPGDHTLILHLDLPPALATSLETVEDADAYLEKAVVDVIRRSIREEFSSREYILSGTARVEDSADAVKLSRLSDRQIRLLGQLADGASNADIARALGMSLPAVKAQTVTLMRKLDLQNRTQMAVFAAKLGLDKRT